MNNIVAIIFIFLGLCNIGLGITYATINRPTKIVEIKPPDYENRFAHVVLYERDKKDKNRVISLGTVALQANSNEAMNFLLRNAADYIKDGIKKVEKEEK